MANSTDRFRVVSIRPVARMENKPVPRDLQEKLEGQVVNPQILEDMGVKVKTARMYHGGDSSAVVYWGDGEYVLDLDAA